MIKKYLENNLEKFLQKKEELEKDLYDLNLREKKNIEFIFYLEKEKEMNYDSFSPRNYEGKQEKQILELKEEQTQIYSEMEQVNLKLKEVNGEIENISVLLKKLLDNEDNGFSIQNLEDIKDKLKICIGFIYSDPERCKIELEDLLRELSIFESSYIDKNLNKKRKYNPIKKKDRKRKK